MLERSETARPIMVDEEPRSTDPLHYRGPSTKAADEDVTH